MNYFVIPGIIRPDRMRKEYGFKKPNDIVAVVLNHFNITYDELIIRSRKTNVVYRRQVLSYLLYRHTKISCVKIAAILGMDRTTIINSVRHLKAMIATEIEIRDEVETLQDSI